MKKPYIILKDTKNVALDKDHTMAICNFADFDVDTIQRFYSPSTVKMSLLLRAMRTIKEFIGKDFNEEYLQIFFSKQTNDQVLLIYRQKYSYNYGSKPEDEDLVITIANTGNELHQCTSLLKEENPEAYR